MKLEKITDAINLLRIVVGDIGIQQMLMLLTIMNEEGITQVELSERFAFQQGSVSKNCKRLSIEKYLKDGKEVVSGMNLIKLCPDPKRYRRLGCWLTPKGKLIKKELMLKLED